jgi:hypothetical protein
VTSGGLFRSAWGRLLCLVVAADAAFAQGLTNRLFYGLHLFPTSLTGLLAGHLGDPSGLAGVSIVSASTPFFWALLAATVALSLPELRRKSQLLPALLAILFLLTQFLLPWWGENGAPEMFLDRLFPAVPRGQGRAYERAYVYVAPLVLLFFILRWRFSRRPGSMDSPSSFV